MPTPDRTSLPEIVAAAGALLEEGGPAAVTMQAVATRVGVRAPSLYKRVRDRDALLTLVAEAGAEDVARRLGGSADLGGLARAYRTFARERPETFRLLVSSRLDAEAAARASAPVLDAAAAAVGPEHALDAARLLTAWATGFATMELAGAFGLGGDLDGAFDYGLERILAGLGA